MREQVSDNDYPRTNFYNGLFWEASRDFAELCEERDSIFEMATPLQRFELFRLDSEEVHALHYLEDKKERGEELTEEETMKSRGVVEKMEEVEKEMEQATIAWSGDEEKNREVMTNMPMGEVVVPVERLIEL